MTRGIRNNNPLNIRRSADRWEGYDLAFPGKRLDRKGRVRSTEPLVLQPVPLPESLEKSYHDWDEYFDWSPMAHWG